RYTNLADIVIISGAKALNGPTSGIIAGKKDLITAVRAHQFGIGRAMKVGKEAVLGLVRAVEEYPDNSMTKKRSEEHTSELQSRFPYTSLFRSRYTNLADIVIISGAKALNGPTSGIIAGKKDLITAVRAHQFGIGRAMKVGKEAVLGLVRAVEEYPDNSMTKK